MVAVPEKLKALAGLFPADKPLFLVGGFVRNALLGLAADADIDICSAMRPEEVFKLLEGTRFKALPVSERLGTLLVVSGSFKAEYTAFRKDSYPASSGVHAPTEVLFTGNLADDAFRRDFTVNALYFDIKNQKIVDPTGGLLDLENKVLRTVRSPGAVFGEDGLRLLRLIRFSAELGFQADAETLKGAAEMSDRLKDISKERIAVEFEKILYADTKYHTCSALNPVLKTGGAHVWGIKLLMETGSIKDYVLPVDEFQFLSESNDYSVLYEALSASSVEARLETFFLGLAFAWLGRLAGFCLSSVEKDGDGKKERSSKSLGSFDAASLAADIAEACLRDLKSPKKQKAETVKTLKALSSEKVGGWLAGRAEADGEACLYVAKNADVIEKIIKLQKTVCKVVMEKVKTVETLSSSSFTSASAFEHMGKQFCKAEYLEKVLDKMRKNDLPFSVKELKIDGNDVKNLGVTPSGIGRVLEGVLDAVLREGEAGTKESQLEKAALAQDL